MNFLSEIQIAVRKRRVRDVAAEPLPHLLSASHTVHCAPLLETRKRGFSVSDVVMCYSMNRLFIKAPRNSTASRKKNGGPWYVRILCIQVGVDEGTFTLTRFGFS